MVDTRASRRVTRTTTKNISRSSTTSARGKKATKPSTGAPGDSDGSDNERLEILDLLLDSTPNNPLGALGSTAPAESTDGTTARTTGRSDSSESADVDAYTEVCKAPEPPRKRGRKPGKSASKRESDPGPEGRLPKKPKGKADDQLDQQLRELSSQLGSKNPQVYQHVNQLLKNICTSTDKIYSNYLTADEAFVLLAKDVALLASSLTPKKGTKAALNLVKSNNLMVQNELMNVLYEKLVLVIIYTCKNKVDSKVIDNVAKLIYKLTNEVHERIVCLNANDNEHNQNKLLLHIWDVLLVLIYCKEKRLRINFTLFLETFVRNACLDEVVINSQLYKKHINALLNLMNDGYSQVYVTSLKLLQSFQAPEVLNILMLNLEHPEEDIRHTTVQILDIVNFEILEALILKLTDTSAKVRSAIYAKLGPLLSSIPTAYMLYVFNRALKENGVSGDQGTKGEVKRENSKLRGVGREGGVKHEGILGFYEAMTAWITELGLVGYVELLMGSTLQLEVVLSVMVKYFTHVASKLNRDEGGDRAVEDAERIYNELVSNKDNLLLMYVNSQLTGDGSVELSVLVSRLRGIVAELTNTTDTGFTNTTDTGFTKSGTKETTTSEVDGEGGKVGEADKVGESRTRVSRFNTLSGKFTKSISFTFGNKFSMVSHRLSSRFTNRLTTSGSATGTNSINTSLSKQLSKGLSTSLSETLNKSLGASLTTGLRNTSSISRNLRKTISQNISKSFSKNFVSTTEVMLGDGTIDRSHEAEGTSDGSSSSSSSIEGAYVASSAEGPPTATGTRTGNVQGLTKKVTRRTECESHSGSGRTVATVDGHPDLTQDKPDRPGSGDHTHEVALSEEPRSSVDYRSFKIIRNSNDFRKTHDDLFNAVNRPSKIVVPDTPGEGSPHNPFFAPATAGASDAAPSGARGLTRSETSAKDQNRGHSSGGKRDKHGSGASKERVVVFPRPLHRYHLAIAKVMMVSISMLTLVVPGLHFLVVSD